MGLYTSAFVDGATVVFGDVDRISGLGEDPLEDPNASSFTNRVVHSIVDETPFSLSEFIDKGDICCKD
ncbi:MAG: hypothetical protein AAB488_01290 [Patescibacteria group bacterium]